MLLSVVTETGESLASLAECMRKFPQVLVNVPVKRKPPIESLHGLSERVSDCEREMNGSGRVLVRYSGTEALARVMIEGPDGGRIRVMADEIAGLIRQQIGDA
jgi:phosphoglucosamine mutase